MPQELLRDVLRAGQANGRARRRLWLLPLSVLLHAMVLAAVVIIPLVAEVDLPTPSSALRLLHVMPVEVPAPPPPPGHGPRRPSTEPPVPFEAPPALAEEAEPHGPAPPFDVTGLPDTAGFGEPGAAGLPVVRVPDPPAPPPPVEQRPLRPGGSIREPRKIRHVPPVYPVLARTARIEGTVILEAIIDERGAVDRVRVIRSEPMLDEAAIQAVRQWRYTPTLLNGIPVPVLMTITVRFALQE